jgi:hypothetical protein
MSLVALPINLPAKQSYKNPEEHYRAMQSKVKRLVMDMTSDSRRGGFFDYFRLVTAWNQLSMSYQGFRGGELHKSRLFSHQVEYKQIHHSGKRTSVYTPAAVTELTHVIASALREPLSPSERQYVRRSGFLGLFSKL